MSGAEANRFVLCGEGIQLAYNSTSITGEPVLTYLEPGYAAQSFRGDEIRQEESTDLGILISVTKETIPDLRTTTLTLLVPHVIPDDESSPVKTVLIEATHRTALVPSTLRGQIDLYRSIMLLGTAEVVQF
jgi:hypothetical protein